MALQHGGYSTSMLGKYLNGYGDPKMTAGTAPVPPGWTDWHVSNSTGYPSSTSSSTTTARVHTYTGRTTTAST